MTTTVSPTPTSTTRPPSERASRAGALGDALDDPTSTGPTTGEIRAAAAVTLGGCVLMVAGAIIGGASGADVFAAMESSSRADVGAHLTDVAAAKPALVANMSLWAAGVPTMAIGGALVARLGRRDGWATVARCALTAGAGAAVVYYSLMMGIVLGLAPAHVAGEDVFAVTRALGWGASTADWVATVLILGVATVALVVSGRGVWTPRWLDRVAYVNAAVAVAATVALIADVRDVTFLIVPAGMVCMFGIAVATWRSAR